MAESPGLYVSLMFDDDNEMVVGVEDPSISRNRMFNNFLKPDEGVCTPRRPRIYFSDSQRRQLEKVFLETPYLKTVDKEALASNIGVTVRQVQIWFQNRRAKCRRKVNPPNSNDKFDRLRYKYHNLLYDRDSIIQELEEERFKNYLLTEEVQKLNQRLIQMEYLKHKFHEI